uniref:Uncharacterized protein n=1 Tax=Anguilla anguilla TaxID=7936 RepID=A0A0E9TQM8_ANGAN
MVIATFQTLQITKTEIQMQESKTFPEGVCIPYLLT